MREVFACMAFMYVYLIYYTYFSLCDGEDTAYQDFVRTNKFMFNPKSILTAIYVGVPIYIISHFSMILSGILALFWIYKWLRKVRSFTYE